MKKSYLYRLVIIILMIVLTVSLVRIKDKAIEKLQAELTEQEEHIDQLKQIKKGYEALVENYEELEENLVKQIEILEEEKTDLTEEKERLEKIKMPSRGASGNSNVFTVTSYDLSVQSCGKKPSHPAYGVTASGTSLVGHTWETIRAIAVDPKVIPLESKVEVTFMDDNYKKYDGVYTAVDTGGAIKGNIIDFFMGDYNQEKSHQDVWDFGRTKAVVRILE